MTANKRKERAIENLRGIENGELVTTSEVKKAAQMAIEVIYELSESSNYYEGKSDGIETTISILFGE